MPAIQVVEFAGSNPWLNLAREEYYLLHLPKMPGDIFLIFYENSPAIILGRSLEAQKEVYLHKNHSPLLRRLSGGGTVNHFKGSLNYSLLLHLDSHGEMKNINESYKIILGALVEGMRPHASLQSKGISDLSLVQAGTMRKVSGNAQVRKRGWMIHHGTFLYDLASAWQVTAFLRQPEKQPDYRANRRHTDFLIKSCPVGSRYTLQNLVQKSFSTLFKLDIKRTAYGGDDKFIRTHLLPGYFQG